MNVEDLRNDIQMQAIAGEGSFLVDAFASVFSQKLEDAEIVSDINVERLQCNGPRGKKLELLGYSESSFEQSLTILSGRYFGSDKVLTMTEAKDILGRATGFIENSANGWHGKNLEYSSREWEYADYFARQISEGKVTKIRVILITDGIMSDRIRSIESGVTSGLKTTYEVWDQKRIIDAALPDLGSEDIHVDLERWIPGGLPCLIAPGRDEATRTYLAVVPAQVLADVFDEYGSLLLESNVRTFLSTRGQVNKGIQGTLAREPERFLAYNNGITTTATSVGLQDSDSGISITSIDKWQIVNGGQTTASIAHFLRINRDADLENVSVQMKLVTVTESDTSSVVQSVAKYANSQNRVSAADLFSTHDFHIRMEQISRRIKAPAREGRQYRSGWYYERARGQWENDRSALATSAQKAQFDLEYPKHQRLTKTDFAKYNYCWNQRPDAVSKGAQTVFADFATQVDNQWSKNDGKGADVFGDEYYRTNVSLAIIYETLRAEVLRQDWYQASRGYLANILAYAIAKFSLMVKQQLPDSELDFSSIWKNQKIGTASLSALVEISHRAQLHLTDTSRPQANVTQWAKQQACWEKFKNVNILLGDDLRSDLVSKIEAQSQIADARKERSVDTGFEIIARIMSVELSIWELALSSPPGFRFSPTESSLIRKFGMSSGAVPSERQASTLLRVLVRMSDQGLIAADSF